MKFNNIGPDLPLDLLNKHLQGRVVFFTGAGISKLAGLPDFSSLYSNVCDELKVYLDKTRENGFLEKMGQFDELFRKLEDLAGGGPTTVRKSAAQQLKAPSGLSEQQLAYHSALLKLGKDEAGRLHIVTTNYDTLFEKAAQLAHETIPVSTPPLLPDPANSDWNSIVYLHGKLSPRPKPEELKQMVLTSRDFGLAYLTRRWASTFVTSLLRNYTVCFVGYSINDTILRYLLSAFNQDTTNSQRTNAIYAFAPCEHRDNKSTISAWKDKGVTPIIYHTKHSGRDHSELVDTLTFWGNLYAKKEAGFYDLIKDTLKSNPNKITSVNSAKILKWAFSAYGTKTQLYFSELIPAPPLSWIYRFIELDSQFLANANEPTCRWITRYLNDPELLKLIINSPCGISNELKNHIENTLTFLAQEEVRKNADALTRFSDKCPPGTPKEAMRFLWNMYLSNNLLTAQVPRGSTNVGHFFYHLRVHGLTPNVRKELIHLLQPRIVLATTFSYSFVKKQLQSPFSWDVVLSAGELYQTFNSEAHQELITPTLPHLFEDLQYLLVKICELAQRAYQTLGEGYSFPSISRAIEKCDELAETRDWMLLIILLRESWNSLLATAPQRACAIAHEWVTSPYLIFRRLALYAATVATDIKPQTWLSWLTSDNEAILKDYSAHYDVATLLEKRGHELSKTHLQSLKSTIAKQPWQRSVCAQSSSPRRTFRELSPSPTPKLPTTETDISQWLVAHPTSPTALQHDNWPQICEHSPLEVAKVILRLKDTPISRLGIALSVWHKGHQNAATFDILANKIQALPISVLNAVEESFFPWLQNAAATCNSITAILRCCDRMYAQFSTKVQPSTAPITIQAHQNFQLYYITSTLIQLWYRENPQTTKKFPSAIRVRLSKIATTHSKGYESGREVLIRFALELNDTAPQWTNKYLNPLFTWRKNKALALSSWLSFIKFPPINYPYFFVKVKSEFLKTARHFNELGDMRFRYAQILTAQALSLPKTIEPNEFIDAIKSLPQEGAEAAFLFFCSDTDNKNPPPEKRWSTKLKPFLDIWWPCDKRILTPRISSLLVRQLLLTGNRTPYAIKYALNWICPQTKFSTIAYLIEQDELYNKFPREILLLANRLDTSNLDEMSSNTLEKIKRTAC